MASTLPPLSLLDDPPEVQETVSVETLEFTSRLIEKKLSDFGVEAKVVAAYPGPVVTRFELELHKANTELGALEPSPGKRAAAE